eukprot:scpid106929/ scgid7167/ 
MSLTVSAQYMHLCRLLLLYAMWCMVAALHTPLPPLYPLQIAITGTYVMQRIALNLANCAAGSQTTCHQMHQNRTCRPGNESPVSSCHGVVKATLRPCNIMQRVPK